MRSSPALPVNISTALTALLGVRHPVMLAPMGDTAGGRLAAAVSDAGGFGLIGGGYADPPFTWRRYPAHLARRRTTVADTR